MKVHEVLTEAPIGTGRIAQWFGKKFQAGKDQEIAKDAIDAWGAYAKQIEKAGTDLTPENYEEELNKWLGQWLKLKGPYPSKLAGLSGVAVSKHIIQAVNQRLTNRIPGAAPLGTGTSDAVTNAPAATAPGVKIINPEPPIIQFRGKDYVLDDLGDWISLESGKILPQSFKQFLDQQLEIAQGLGPGSIKRQK